MLTTAAFLASHIKDVPDFPRPGILFRDVSPLLQNAEAFRGVINMMAQTYRDGGVQPTHIVGIESRGFIFGSALAFRLGCGFVPARKEGKLPGMKSRVSYTLEYGEATLEMQAGALGPDDRVVIVDDLLATGGTAMAAATLVRQLKATVLSLDVVIELRGLGGRAALERSGLFGNVNAVLVYP